MHWPATVMYDAYQGLVIPGHVLGDCDNCDLCDIEARNRSGEGWVVDGANLGFI
jgi:hypothetical protein